MDLREAELKLKQGNKEHEKMRGRTRGSKSKFEPEQWVFRTTGAGKTLLCIRRTHSKRFRRSWLCLPLSCHDAGAAGTLQAAPCACWPAACVSPS